MQKSRSNAPLSYRALGAWVLIIWLGAALGWGDPVRAETIDLALGLQTSNIDLTIDDRRNEAL